MRLEDAFTFTDIQYAYYSANCKSYVKYKFEVGFYSANLCVVGATYYLNAGTTKSMFDFII